MLYNINNNKNYNSTFHKYFSMQKESEEYSFLVKNTCTEDMKNDGCNKTHTSHAEIFRDV